MKQTILKRFALIMLFAFSFQFSHALYVAIYCYEREGKPNRYLRAWCSIARDDYGSQWLNSVFFPPPSGTNPNSPMFRVASPEELSDGATPPPHPLVPVTSELQDYLLNNWEIGPTVPLNEETRDFVMNNFKNAPVIYDVDPYTIPFAQLVDMGNNGFVDFFGVKILGNPSEKGKIEVQIISIKEQDLTASATDLNGTFIKDKVFHVTAGINTVKLNWNEEKYGSINFKLTSANNTYSKNVYVLGN